MSKPQQQQQLFSNSHNISNKVKPFTNGVNTSLGGVGGMNTNKVQVNPFGSLKSTQNTLIGTTSNSSSVSGGNSNTNSLTSPLNEKKIISFK